VNCPRCSTDLTAVAIESSNVMACSNCEGTWYPDEALGDVTDHSFSELKETALAQSLVPDQLAKVDLDEPVNCPQCQKQMSRYTYSLVCPIVLDECIEHGVWLDDGELGTLMQYLTELDKRVGAKQEEVLSGRNLSTLEELSKSPTFYSLPGNVLATLNAVHSRARN
jgi:Zn-finger nucleic acid-binding protein